MRMVRRTKFDAKTAKMESSYKDRYSMKSIIWKCNNSDEIRVTARVYRVYFYP
jgi:hypothetical protein